MDCPNTGIRLIQQILKTREKKKRARTVDVLKREIADYSAKEENAKFIDDLLDSTSYIYENSSKYAGLGRSTYTTGITADPITFDSVKRAAKSVGYDVDLVTNIEEEDDIASMRKRQTIYFADGKAITRYRGALDTDWSI